MELLKFMLDLGLPGSFILVTVLATLATFLLHRPFIAMVDAWCDHVTHFPHWLKTCVACGHLSLFGVWIAMWVVCAILYVQMEQFLQ